MSDPTRSDSLLPDLRLTGALVMIDGALHDAPLTLSQGRIAQGRALEVDLSGYWLLPGIVDLHGDGFDRHLRPRPTAPFDTQRALLNADAELAANGVTTAWFAQSWSWEGGSRSAEAAEDLMESVARMAHGLMSDIRVQVRFETHMTDDHDRLMAAITRFGVDMLVFNNHLPEAVVLADGKPDRFAVWAGQNGHAPEGLLAIVREAQRRDPIVPDSLTALAARLRAAGVRMGSHDDGDAATRAFYRGIGAPICEFPTTFDAARSARAAGEPILMGAPNVVRGGSQAGNIAAMALIEDGLCDALMSDYYYPALSQAAWVVADQRAMPFPRAWDMISATPARIMGLTDRGTLTPGQRADVVVMNPETRVIEATIAGGRLACASREAGARLMRARRDRALAAE
jgi:alpha-D-ribose 1-methylphosphonate 5-triphosphate diphosphatase